MIKTILLCVVIIILSWVIYMKRKVYMRPPLGTSCKVVASKQNLGGGRSTSTRTIV